MSEENKKKVKEENDVEDEKKVDEKTDKVPYDRDDYDENGDYIHVTPDGIVGGPDDKNSGFYIIIAFIVIYLLGVFIQSVFNVTGLAVFIGPDSFILVALTVIFIIVMITLSVILFDEKKYKILIPIYIVILAFDAFYLYTNT